MKIAILGAGMTGLATAYYLHKAGVPYTIFEKQKRLGGSAYTAKVTIHNQTRWVDMGTSDFNFNTYHIVRSVLDEMDIPYRPLQNSTGFYNEDGSVCYALGKRLGVPPPPDIVEDLARFRKDSIEVLTETRFQYYTIQQYLKERQYHPDFANLCLYPRVSALPFADENSLRDMPIRFILDFYAMQEGFNLGENPNPLRMYFENGVQYWLHKLEQIVGKNTLLGIDVQLRTSEKGVEIFENGNLIDVYDAAVLTVSAEEVVQRFGDSIAPEALKVLQNFEYATHKAYLHTFLGDLPHNPNAWGSFNAYIREDYNNPAIKTPYSLTQVVNYHQFDLMNEKYNREIQPFIFLTFNPIVPIPEKFLLRDAEGEPICRTFRHLVGNMKALKAQTALERLQGKQHLYFCGSYTQSVGLLEHCWSLAKEMCENIISSHRKRYFFEN
jgi:predicted NAD/FAD-binding protein